MFTAKIMYCEIASQQVPGTYSLQKRIKNKIHVKDKKDRVKQDILKSTTRKP